MSDVSAYHQLMSLLSTVPLITWIELISLLEGVRPAAIVCVPGKDVELWRKATTEAGLVCLVADYPLIEVAARDGNHTLVRATHGVGARHDVVLAHSVDVARRLADTDDDLERGRALGYPDCCVRAYVARGRRAEWLDALLNATPESEVLPAACNRISALIDGRALVPDYFPCSFACDATRGLGDITVRTLQRISLGRLADRAIAHLVQPIVVTPEACIRLPLAGHGEYTDAMSRLPVGHSSVDRFEIVGEKILVWWRDNSISTSPHMHEIIRVLRFSPPERRLI